MEQSDDIDVPLTEMSVDDLRQLKSLYTQSLDYYKKLLAEGGISEGNVLAVNLCMAEIQKDLEEIEALITEKLIPKDGST
jgi:hypothetical protein